MPEALALNSKTPQGVEMLRLLEGRYNKGKEQDPSRQLVNDKNDAVFSCRVRSGRVLMSDTYNGKIERPKLKVKAEIENIFMSLGDVDSIRFLEDQRPELTYSYELKDEEIKGFIDAGLYTNPRFEEVLSKLLKDEVFEAEGQISLHHMELPTENGIVPFILADTLDGLHYDQPTQDSQLDYEVFETFHEVVENVTRYARDLNEKGLVSQVVPEAAVDESVDLSALLGASDVYQPDVEPVVQSAPVSEPGQPTPTHEGTLDHDDMYVANQLAQSDSVIYGETDEDDEIRRLKEQEREREQLGQMFNYGSDPVYQNDGHSTRTPSRDAELDL